MNSNQLIEARSARLGSDVVLRQDSIALLAADGYLLPREECAPVASWRSWQGTGSDAGFTGMAMVVGAVSDGGPAEAKGGKRIDPVQQVDAVQGGHICDVHVTDTTTFPTSLGPPPSCLPV